MILIGLAVLNILALNIATSRYASNRGKVQPDEPTRLEKNNAGEVDYDYNEIYNSFGTHGSYADRRISDFDSFGNYTSTAVLNGGCRLTVSIVDPRPPTSGINHPIWFALESVAAYVPYACVVFHTSSCKSMLQTQNMPAGPTDGQKVNAVAQSIYGRSLPLFRRMMERGLVRVNVLNSEKYGEKCDNFGSGNSIFLNIRFWLDEFIDGVDSDMILTTQQDAVLCRHLDIDLWKHYAYVGAPWSPWVWGCSQEQNCDCMRNLWRTNAPKCNGVENHLAEENILQICTPGHGGFQGNGGLSIRNRSWMIEALRRCPTQFSGLGTQEDVFFSTVLNAINATMPSAFEAALFSVCSTFAEQTFDIYYKLNSDEIADTVKRLWGNDTGMSVYNRIHQSNSSNRYTIPLGIHQLWNYGHAEHCQGVAPEGCTYALKEQPNIHEECKFLKYIYNFAEMQGGRLQ
ncbi:hypothetical protein ACHAW5_001795 [Stephanodiscus triporus]|uniref:DUF5672 domain-containing protein n=1 Tax=Stephanodiscus triporus TaxID=2934178 RepID=A0ABD3MSK1_9STRA